MKGLLIVAFTLTSLNTFALQHCTPEAQGEIDTLLVKMEQTQNKIRKIDLEFEVRRISFSYSNCRKSILNRNVASVDLPEMDVEVTHPDVLEEQALANKEIEEVLKLK